ncbi:MAG: hypothetical protein ACRDFZ_06870 [Candidatus Limnocylindria bacterium]
MAGTLPHAVFVETGIDDAGRAMAFAGELPGCATIADDPATAAGGVPARVAAFVAWLRRCGEDLVEPVGNWYEVERAASTRGPDGGLRRAAFSLDELPPSAAEFETWLRWAELAREELAAALDARPSAADDLEWLAAQDAWLTTDLAPVPGIERRGSGLDRLYDARDALTAALAAAGPGGTGVRRALRLAIADDLRAVELLATR